MRFPRSVRKDHISAALLLVLGCTVLGVGATYQVGTLNTMGPGFIPVSLGVMIILVALAIGVTAAPPDYAAATRESRQGEADGGPQWRGWICIIAGVASFVILGNYGGLVPATFAAVFVSAMGDRESTVKTSAILAAAITVFGAAIFHFGLQLQLPLFQWGG